MSRVACPMGRPRSGDGVWVMKLNPNEGGVDAGWTLASAAATATTIPRLRHRPLGSRSPLRRIARRHDPRPDSRQRFSQHGRFWHFDDVILEPPPLQSPHPPLWVSAGRDASIRAAAARGLRLLLDQFTPIETIAPRVATFREAAGARYDPAMIVVASDVYIGDSETETQAALNRPCHRPPTHDRRCPRAQPILRFPHPRLADRPEARTEAALYGSQDHVAAKLQALQAGGHLCAVRHPRPVPADVARIGRPFRRAGTCGTLTGSKGISHDR